jgi:hypothetical protein
MDSPLKKVVNNKSKEVSDNEEGNHNGKEIIIPQGKKTRRLL